MFHEMLRHLQLNFPKEHINWCWQHLENFAQKRDTVNSSEELGDHPPPHKVHCNLASLKNNNIHYIFKEKYLTRYLE
jgi:hypothetical protein